MPSPELEEAARQIADAFAPSLLTGKDVTVVVVVGDGEGWSMALRGSLPVAVKALEAAHDDALRGEGFRPYDPAVA